MARFGACGNGDTNINMNALFSSDVSSPGYIESKASTNRKTKESLRIDQLIPKEVLQNSEGMKNLLEAYYIFMNMDEFIYQEYETFTDIILDGRANFRIPDPEGKNNRFFTDEFGQNSTLVLTDAEGNNTFFDLDNINVNISNGNELPGSLEFSTSEIGKTFSVFDLNDYNTQTATLTTQVKYWVGPGPSYVLNTIEEALNIDSNNDQYLELMQKEIAATIPRNLTVDKRNLYKRIIDYYRVRGSTESIEIFFRLLFNEYVEVEYPYNSTLIPSSGNWSVNPDLPKGGQYLDNKGFLSYNIKLHDSYRYQRFSYLIRTGKNVTDWEDAFSRLVHPSGFIFFGEILIFIELTKAELGQDDDAEAIRKVLSALPYLQPGVIGLEDLPVLVKAIASSFLPSLNAQINLSAQIDAQLKGGVIYDSNITNSGSGYTSAPSVTIIDDVDTGYTPATATTSISGGSVSSVTITDGGLNYDIPLATVSDPDPLIFDGSNGNNELDFVANTIVLDQTSYDALDTGDRVLYSSGGGTSVGGLVDGDFYYVIDFGTDNKILLASSQQDAFAANSIPITGAGSGSSHSFTGETAQILFYAKYGLVDSINIISPGYGYQTPPTVTIAGVATSGETITPAEVTLELDDMGQVVDYTIVEEGSWYDNIFLSVEANPTATGISSIDIAGLADKNYRVAPTVVIPAPEAIDNDNNPLPTNVQATAEFTLDSDGEITGITITEPGSGYLENPQVRIASNMQQEIRAKDWDAYLNIYVNFKPEMKELREETSYFQRKKASFGESEKRFGINASFTQLGHIAIEDIDSATLITDINKFNQNTFIIDRDRNKLGQLL